MKRVLTVALALALLLSVTACTGGEREQTPTPEPAPTDARARESGKEPTPEPAETVAPTAIAPLPIAGRWTLSYATDGENRYAGEDFGDQTITLVFSEDGSAQMFGSERTVDSGMSWVTESETTVGLYAHGVTKICEIVYEAGTETLMLFDAESGTNLYFEKAEE